MRIFFPKNGTVFWAKLELFVVLPKFDQNNIFQKFKKNLVQKGWNQHKMARDVEIRAPGGRESLWTTGEKFDFLQAHCEVQNQPNLIFTCLIWNMGKYWFSDGKNEKKFSLIFIFLKPSYVFRFLTFGLYVVWFICNMCSLESGVPLNQFSSVISYLKGLSLQSVLAYQIFLHLACGLCQIQEKISIWSNTSFSHFHP